MACSLSGEKIRVRAYREEGERERVRRDIYNTIIMEQETDGRWQSFLISRVHDKLLLMSDAEKRSNFR
jgi:hypothetical protein